METVFDWAVNHWAFTAFCIGIVFEVPKWKLKPFSALFGWIGRKINHPVLESIDNVKADLEQTKQNTENDLKEIKEELDRQQRLADERDMDYIRTTVLDFINSCRNGRKHSKEEFTHIFDLDSKYRAYLEKYKTKNGVYMNDFKWFEEIYHDRLEKNDFLA